MEQKKGHFVSICNLFATTEIFSETLLKKDKAHTRLEDNIQEQQSEGFMVDISRAQLVLLFVGKDGNRITE